MIVVMRNSLDAYAALSQLALEQVARMDQLSPISDPLNRLEPYLFLRRLIPRVRSGAKSQTDRRGHSSTRPVLNNIFDSDLEGSKNPLGLGLLV